MKRNVYIIENSNRSHGFGNLELDTFEPFPKNPPISKVFREIGLADELGSGMRNTYKYTRLYSGTEPQFVEGDIFRTIIPLSEAATGIVGSNSSILDIKANVETNTEVTTEASTEVTTEANTEVKLNTEKLSALLDFCKEPRSRSEMQKFCEIKTEKYFREQIIKPLLKFNIIKRTIPDKPNSPKQKYIKV